MHLQRFSSGVHSLVGAHVQVEQRRVEQASKQAAKAEAADRVLAKMTREKEEEMRKREELEDLINRLHFEEQEKKFREQRRLRDEQQERARKEMLQVSTSARPTGPRRRSFLTLPHFHAAATPAYPVASSHLDCALFLLPWGSHVHQHCKEGLLACLAVSLQTVDTSTSFVSAFISIWFASRETWKPGSVRKKQ